MQKFEPEKVTLHLRKFGHKSVMYRPEPKHCTEHQPWLPHPAEISHAQKQIASRTPMSVIKIT